MHFRLYVRDTERDERWGADIELAVAPEIGSTVTLEDGQRILVTHALDIPAGYDGAFAGDELPEQGS